MRRLAGGDDFRGCRLGQRSATLSFRILFKKAAARDFPRRLHPTRYLCTPVILKTHQQRRAYQGFNPLAYCKNKFCL